MEPFFTDGTESLWSRLPAIYRESDEVQTEPVALAGQLASRNLMDNPAGRFAASPYNVYENKAVNPRAAVDLGGWDVDPAGAPLSLYSDALGTWARRAGGGNWIYTRAEATIGTYYAYRVTVRTQPGLIVTAQNSDYVVGGIGANVAVTVGTSGIATLDVPAGPNPSAGPNVYVGVSLNSPTDAIDVTNVICQAVTGPGKRVRGPYFDGSTADLPSLNFGWSAGAHASPSYAVGNAVEVHRNLALYPRTPYGFGNDGQWQRDVGAPITGHPLGFTTGTRFWRDPAINPLNGTDAIASLYTVDGLGDSPVFRYYGLWVKSSRIADAVVSLVGSTITKRLQPNKWEWIVTPAKGTSYSGLTVKTIDGSPAAINDSVWVSGVLSSETLTPYFDGGLPDIGGVLYGWTGVDNATESVQMGVNANRWYDMNGSLITHGAGDSMELRVRGRADGTGGSGAYHSNATGVIGRYYAARCKVARIPGELQDGGFSVRVWDNTRYTTEDSGYIQFSDLPVDGSPITINMESAVAAGDAGMALFFYSGYEGSVRITEAIVEEVSGPGMAVQGDYFDGDTPQPNDVRYPSNMYGWEGTPNLSVSTRKAFTADPGGYPFKRYISALGDVLGVVGGLYERFDYEAVDGDLSDLVYAPEADDVWLDYIAQILGVGDISGLTIPRKRVVLNDPSVGYRAGTPESIIAAAKTAVGGSGVVGLYKRTTDVSAIGAATEWDILIVTRSGEVTGDVVQAVIDLGVKPAGVVLYHREWEVTWNDIHTQYPTWADINALPNWDALEKTGI